MGGATDPTPWKFPAATRQRDRLAGTGGGQAAGMVTETELRQRRIAHLRSVEPRLRIGSDVEPTPWPGSRAPGVTPGPHPPRADGSPSRGERLARELGGRLESTPEGNVVVVEREQTLPLDPGPLASLPYPIDPDRPLILLDTETTGLGTGTGTVVFLAGFGLWEGDRLRVTQLWLPDHSDEPAFLTRLAASIPPDAWLVTYNGRTFDWPLLTTRYRLFRRDPPPIAGHLDLLPVARQIFRHRLPDARLASVEAGVAGVRRVSDLPGALVPGRYFAWLSSGSPDMLREVLEHNHQDVVSMGLLLAVLATRLADPAGHGSSHPGDLAALARIFRRNGQGPEALRCLEAALALPDPERGLFGGQGFDRGRAWLDQAALFALSGDRAGAIVAWDEAVRCGGRTAIRAWIARAKLHEHADRDPRAALFAAERAASLCGRRRLVGVPDTWAERDLMKRLRRLRRRVSRIDSQSPPPAAAEPRATPGH